MSDSNLSQSLVLPEVDSGYPPFPESLPEGSLSHGQWRVRFAREQHELDAILCLRFEVFNLELEEGLDESYDTGRDEDPFDRQCHHLLVEDVESGQVVGTYRLQTYEMAQSGIGFYSAGEFDLSQMPEDILTGSMEVGRACIHRDHRNRQVLFLLWRGLALYVLHNRKRYFFGCCSLTTQNLAEGVKLYRQLDSHGQVCPEFEVPPLASTRCVADDDAVARVPEIQLPALFRTYLRYGGQVCSGPAIDREFKTIDYLVLLDVERISSRSRKMFFGDLEDGYSGLPGK